ncbi:hypothetical protein Pelo_5329 [Pelomyxa schiedti]|nr:hypothetical protein Pelo_5329 [Pelomyxa schiedti]
MVGCCFKLKLLMKAYFIVGIVATAVILTYSVYDARHAPASHNPAAAGKDGKRQLLDTMVACTTDLAESECGYPERGWCNGVYCVCNEPWITLDVDNNDRMADSTACNYEGKSKLTAFLLSFFVGSFGADWFYLARGSGGYIAAGVFKLLTLGGCGIWSTVDWIRLLCDAFPDGNKEDLYDDM